jgi:prepilin-type N-terminal cleavage/methylation domain-containing protein
MKVQSKLMQSNETRQKLRSGFTLVELLVVIAIIGVLVGITLPAVQAVRLHFDKTANKFEVQSLNDAVEKYRGIYGDYPPDGSSAAIMQRHLRKAFPNILQSEIDLLTGVQLDPAEALVFFLGGFSSDKQRPFTGKGGPIVNTGTTAAPVYNYNPARENSMHEFVSGRLVLDDEYAFAGGTSDVFPVYMARNNTVVEGCPYVYFDSRTYNANRGTAANPIYNCYQPSDIVATTVASSARGKLGAVRPYLSAVNGAGAKDFVFENSKTFQIIGPGTDGFYGGRIVSLGAQWFTSKGLSYTFNGTGMDVDTAAPRLFELTENVGTLLTPAHDNVSNFTDTATLGENISN